MSWIMSLIGLPLGLEGGAVGLIGSPIDPLMVWRGVSVDWMGSPMGPPHGLEVGGAVGRMSSPIGPLMG